MATGLHEPNPVLAPLRAKEKANAQENTIHKQRKGIFYRHVKLRHVLNNAKAHFRYSFIKATLEYD